MQTEWKANTGKWALLVRSVSTVFLARRISKSVKKLARELEERKVDEEDAKVQWLDLHRKNAKLTHQHILKYRGFLIKVGQAASIKAGDLPAPWAEELRGLQDELPVSPFKEVKRTVRVDLGKPLDQIFHHFEQRPIASASVAQAHIAWLRNDNRKVCVKVQHRGVASMMSTDLATVNFIVSRMPKHHPDSPDFSDLIKEWRRASREEVDFRLEARNALQALHALRKAKLNVTCPEPIAACCGRRVLTMAYINGWKITDVDHLPFGTDREALVRPLVDAFAMLAFEEGLIHGDPHPGNVFVEPVEDPSSGGAGGSSSSSSKPKQVRAALLDWGIVQRMSEKERGAAARWAVASLAQDRVMYLQALMDLGFAFDMDFDSSDFASFLEAFMGHSAWLLRDSIPISSQQNFLEKWRQHQENAEQQRMRTGYREPTRAVSKIGGVIYFFLRGLEMLQNICSALEVTLPFASVILHRAMPLIQGSSKGILRALPLPSGCSELEQTVRSRLQQLEEEGLILGAQVAVLQGDVGSPGEWLCRVAVGRSSVTGGGPVTDSTMMPLLDASVGVLVLCLLAAMAHPTVTGRTVGLDTPVSQLWPDFAQRDKGRFTIGQVLQHRAGLQRAFPMELSLKAFCNEQRMEQLLAALPREHPTEAACRVLGNVAAALLRRAVGRRSAAEAVKTILEPLGLHDQIAYRGLDKRMAFVGKKPRDGLPMEELWEWLEEKVDIMEAQADRKASWLTWRELASEKPGYTDPMLVNREVLRNGEGCLPGRGLRANAESICRLYSSKLLPQELLERSRTPARQLHPKTWEESAELGHCLDFGEGGWQLFRFESLEGGEEVLAHGHIDGSTGSLTLRLPKASVVVLLNSADKRTRHVGYELLTSVVRHFGLKPAWTLKQPDKGRAVKLAENVAGGAPTEGELPEEVQCTITKMKAKVARLTEALAAAGVTLDEEEEEEEEVEEEPQKTLTGSWKSAETEGLQALLEAFDVPAMVRTFAQTARRNLNIKVEGDRVFLHTNTCFMGRQVEETSNEFTVGKAFDGQQELGGAFTGLAKWTEPIPDGDGATKGEPSPYLTVEKRFVVGGREVVVVERFLLSADGRLALTTILRSGGEQGFEVCSAEELQHVCSKLDPETLRLRSELQLGSEYLPRGGRIAGTETGASLEAICSLSVPRTLTFQYDDLESTTMFDRVESQNARRGRKAKSKVGTSKVRQSGIADGSSPINVTPPFSNLSDLVPTGSTQVTDCAMGLAAVGWAAATLASSALQALGRTLDNMCVNHQMEALGKARSPPALCNDTEVQPLLLLDEGGEERPDHGDAVLLEESRPEPQPQPSEYLITLDRCNGVPLGIGIDDCPSQAHGDSTLPCVSSLSGTLVGQWNLDHSEPQVRIGDRVVEVNGVHGDAFEMMRECSKMQIMEIKLLRHSAWRCCWAGGIRIRAVPDLQGDPVGETVAHNEIVLVSEEHRGPDGILYLRLVDGRGWIFQHRPDLGTVCVRHNADKGPSALEETPETKSQTSRASEEESLPRSVSLANEAPAEDLRSLAAPVPATWADAAGGKSMLHAAAGERVEASQLPGQRALGLQEKVFAPLPLCTKAASQSPRLPVAVRQSPSSQTVWEPAMEPSTPSVGSKAPVKFEEDSVEFTVVLRRTSSSSLGLRADPADGGSKLVVHSIEEGGLLARWNASCSLSRRVHIGDRIVSINGCAQDARLLVEELCRAGQTLHMRLERTEASFSSLDTTVQEDLDRCLHPPCCPAEPKPAVIFIADPRRGQGRDVGVLAFSSQGCEGPWDLLCGADFLGGHFNAGPLGLQLEAPCDRGRRWTFGNSEAAFQALRFWLLAGEFSPLSASAALKKAVRLRGHEDPTYAGFGSSWRGMFAVLRAKFAPGSSLAGALVKTQEAFLLNHWPVEGEEDLWSDNGLGDGWNWLGLQLMLLRDELSGQGLWTDYLRGLLDLDTGKARGPLAAGKWQDTVHRATAALADAVGPLRQVRPNTAPTDFRPERAQ